MYVGQNCYTSPYALNNSMIIMGSPGSGKTVRMCICEIASLNMGETTIVLDINSTHADEMIFEPIRAEYLRKANRIDVKQDGLDIEFLKPMFGRNGKGEDFVDMVNSAVYALGGTQRMGSRQIGALRNAIIFAVEHRRRFPDEMSAIGVGLLQQEDSVANSVYQKLWTVINSKVFRAASKCIQPGMINLISFTGMDKMTQGVFVEIFLASLWRNVRYQGLPGGNEIVLSIDEFQNLPLREGSVLRDMLCEGRKFGISLLLATQTLKCFPKDTLAILDQAGTKLYFRPAISEIRSIAKVIAPDDVERWFSVLSRLRVGEAVAMGNLMVGGVEINHPVLTR